MSGYAVSKVARFSAVEITLGYAVEAGSGHSVGTPTVFSFQILKGFFVGNFGVADKVP
jgi:hypothetical protein